MVSVGVVTGDFVLLPSILLVLALAGAVTATGVEPFALRAVEMPDSLGPEEPPPQPCNAERPSSNAGRMARAREKDDRMVSTARPQVGTSKGLANLSTFS